MANIVFPFNYKIPFNKSNYDLVFQFLVDHEVKQGFEIRVYSKCILVSGSRVFYDFREFCVEHNISIEKEW